MRASREAEQAAVRPYPRRPGGVGVLKQIPDHRLPLPPQTCVAVGGRVLDAEALPDLLLLVAVVHVELENVESLLRVPVLPVGHPAAGLHVRLVDAPEGQLLLEQRSAHIRRAVELPGAVVVEHVGENARVAVKEVLVGPRVVLDEAGDLLQLIQHRINVRVGGEQGQSGPRQRL